MNTKTKNFASAFVFAALVLNMVSLPASLPEGGETEKTRPALENRDDAFLKAESLEFEEYFEHTLIGETSFMSGKTPPNKTRVVTARMWIFTTAYSSTPDQTDSSPFITASGSRVRDGIIAANFLPFGTKVRFPTIYGDKIFVVEDRMNSRYAYRADIWMRSRWEAKQFGLRNIPIEIIKEI